MSQVFKVGNIEVKNGKRKTGLLKIAEQSLFPINIPITILNGAKTGPTICFSAGQHSCEYTGIETCIRLSKNIDPENLKGTIIFLPVLNVLGFHARVSYFEDSMASSHLYSLMAENIFKEAISKSNYWVNFHGGELVESMPIPFVLIYLTGIKEVDDASRKLAICFNIEYILERPTFPEKKPEKPFYGWMKAEDRTRNLSKLKIPSIVPEAGHEGKLEEKFVSLFYDGALNVLKHLKMIEGTPAIPPCKQKTISEWKFVTTDRGGMFYSNFKVGDKVSKGEIIGEIRNIHGETMEKIRSPLKGMILLKVNTLPWDVTLGGGSNVLYLICKTPND